MLATLTAIVLLLVVTEPSVSGEITPKDIEKALDRNVLHHPYLYFSAEDRPVILDRIQNDANLREIVQKQIAEADRHLESQPSANQRAAFTLAFAYQVTGDEKYAAKAYEYAELLCAQDTWTTSEPHKFPIIYDRVWPWGSADDQVVFDYDIVASTITRNLAFVYDWLYPALDKRQRDRIRGALLEKAVTRVRGNYEYYWWAWAYRCNWCPWCNCGLGLASIALLTEDPQLTDVIAESYNRISRYLDEIRDGCTQEGTSYMTTAMDNTLMFADALNRITNKAFNLYKHENLQNVVNTYAQCHVAPARSIRIGETGGSRLASYTILNKIMLETGDRQAAWLRKQHHNDTPTGVFDIFFPKSIVAPALPKQTSFHFRAINWAIMRSDFTDPEKILVACACGLNDDPHHGHLDVGHLNLFWRTVEFIADSGTGTYTKTDFTEERWNNPLVSSLGHNVVFVNGEEQIPSKRKNTPWDMSIGGTILTFRPGDDLDYTLMDPTNAYPKKELKQWRRHITLDKPVITVVLDEIACSPGAEIAARFFSIAEHTISDTYVMLKHEVGTMALIPFVDEGFTVRHGEHPGLRLTYFETVVTAKKDKTVVGAVILPVTSEREAREVAQSLKQETDGAGNLAFSFVQAGKRHHYTYDRRPDGLVFTGKR